MKPYLLILAMAGMLVGAAYAKTNYPIFEQRIFNGPCYLRIEPPQKINGEYIYAIVVSSGSMVILQVKPKP